MATLSQFTPSEEGNSSGQGCLSAGPQRARPRSDVAFYKPQILDSPLASLCLLRLHCAGACLGTAH